MEPTPQLGFNGGRIPSLYNLCGATKHRCTKFERSRSIHC